MSLHLRLWPFVGVSGAVLGAGHQQGPSGSSLSPGLGLRQSPHSVASGAAGTRRGGPDSARAQRSIPEVPPS